MGWALAVNISRFGIQVCFNGGHTAATYRFALQHPERALHGGSAGVYHALKVFFTYGIAQAYIHTPIILRAICSNKI